ncbi:protein ENHANCED DISEASE RESISTANCE 2-like isoform X2 [Oryza brachyantha]|uniref:protein ENHANCED DISEASE RESISTANCE 2-like isoform X2 n=1 Tax=Oryza brachyantha TaxID=4533 RepID=UPI001ADCC911|nr:protein ENHANCED DISEASE RESISTANCE 2-like isoform X2 [Oryza brachyantha]
MSPRKGQQAEAEQQRSWREEAVSAASLRQVDLERGTNGWASPAGDLFHLRARGYFSGGGGGRRGKAPSAAEWLLRPAGVDWLRSHSRLDHVLAREDNPVAAAFRRARLRKDPAAHFLLAVNLQVPGRPDAYSAVFYFAAEAPIPPDSLLGRFVHGDDAYRNSRFKIVNRIVKGPWLVRATVGNYAACLLGRALTCRYHKGDDYLEIDVDIGSSAIASAILHLALGAVTSVTIDMGFLVESQSEEELPERLFGAVRIAQMEMGAAKYVETAPEEAASEAAAGGRAGAGFRVGSAKVAHDSRHQERAGGKVGRSMSCQERESGGR